MGRTVQRDVGSKTARGDKVGGGVGGRGYLLNAWNRLSTLSASFSGSPPTRPPEGS